ncbi:MAG TPA: DNA alkylation repair protein [Fimbriiglobus sp.]|jgi:3-methyladenine DNA glycosylase AlkD|nr:DNA alkylation repair protein [Fimbriiglobus sp.]
MPTADEVLAELKTLGNASIKKVLLRHGAREPFYGVKVEDLKKIQKRVKTDHDLALALYATGVSDAMYLAGLIADPARMTKADLRKWVKGAYWNMLAGYTVPWVASESRYAVELATEWMDSPKELIAVAGWTTYSSYVSIRPDEELDLDEIEGLLGRVQKEIPGAANLVRYAMNGFVIAVGGAVAPLTTRAKAAAKAIGPVEVDMGETSCQVPDALQYINKIEAAGRLGKKRKTAAC